MKPKEHSGHRDRIKSKILKNGLDGFLDYEILEALLFYTIPMKDTKEVAKGLLKKFKTLEKTLSAPKDEILSLKIKGITENTCIYFKLLHDLNKKMYKEKFSEQIVLNSVEAVYDYLKSSIGLLEKEVFKIIFLSADNKYLGDEIIFLGTIDRSQIYPREIVKQVLKYNAKSVIFSHNHPSGNPKPSRADLEMTKKLKEILEPLEVKVLDHIIITPEKYYSFLEEGII
ncbi:MAG: DNA repair protein RadC [Psychrilyobacter sp.]|uniref:RadC family protein n=1 Tax=Psychrilyobacter sp. TaxID=2586924 RepID=UPI003C78A620